MSPSSLARALRARLAVVTLAGSVLALALWTVLVTRTSVLSGLDGAPVPAPAAGSASEQVWTAIAVVSMPIVSAVLLVVVAWWAWQRRLRNLSAALVISVALGWGGNHLLKVLVRRPRPDSPLELITNQGWSYPSGHAAMATTAAVMAIATTTTTRQSLDMRYLWRVVGVLGILVVCWDRFVLRAHHPSDIVAGVLMGLASASLACWAARVHMVPVPPKRRPSSKGSKQVAVVWNPSKFTDRGSFRRTVEWELDQRGWPDALWLQTTADDPGRGMARKALDAGVDLVLVAGGDGTVRVVCSELAGSGLPVAIIPSGTGNLLARNLEIPLDAVEAARLAFAGTARPVDLIEVTTDDHPTEHFAVMAGLGFDARIMENTRPELKKTVGSAAYFVAAAQELTSEPMELTFQVDDQEPQHRRAMMAVVGNVGILQGGIHLIPRASASDGLLDVVIASPKGYVDWARMTAQVVGARQQHVDGVDQLQGRRVRIEVTESTPYELDGDTAGHTRVFTAEIAPGALLLVQP